MALDLLQLLDTMQKQYPQYWHIITQPGIFDAIANGINDPENWPPQRVDAAIHETAYYQNTSQAMRQWNYDKANDPATVRSRMEDVKQKVDDAQAQLGIKLDGGGLGYDYFNSDYFKFLEEAAANNWSFQEIKYKLSQRGGFGSGGGEIEVQTASVKQLSDDFGVPYSDFSARIWGTQLARGTIDMKAVAGYLAQQAKSLYPGIATMLDRGFTVRQIADPYLEIARQELGINTETISLTDPLWSAALNTVGKDGVPSSLSLADWTRKIRTDPAYGYDYTLKAGEQAAQLSRLLSQKMGAL